MNRIAFAAGLLALTAARADDDFREFKGHEGPTRVVRFTPDGTKLVSCSGWPEGDKTVRVWDVKCKRWDVPGKKEKKEIKPGAGGVDNLALLADGKQAVVACDQRLARWNLETGEEVKRYAAPALSVAVSADGKKLLTGRYQG